MAKNGMNALKIIFLIIYIWFAKLKAEDKITDFFRIMRIFCKFY